MNAKEENTMKKTGKTVLVSLIMLGFVILPGLSQAVDREAKFHEYRQKMLQQLNLSPDKAKEFTEAGDKYMKDRMDLYAQLKTAMDNLKHAMAATPKDEGKIKDAVDAVTAVKDKLWNNYQDWWHADMKLLNPEQQAHYLITLENWWKKIMSGHEGMHEGKKCM
jgi:Spy/CpxP family protein refolding chaperone